MLLDLKISKESVNKRARYFTDQSLHLEEKQIRKFFRVKLGFPFGTEDIIPVSSLNRIENCKYVPNILVLIYYCLNKIIYINFSWIFCYIREHYDMKLVNTLVNSAFIKNLIWTLLLPPKQKLQTLRTRLEASVLNCPSIFNDIYFEQIWRDEYYVDKENIFLQNIP